MAQAAARHAWAAADEHRVTPFGAFLRRFRLDEIPQLWNVIRGDLALIGPRPEQVPIAEQLQKEIAHYAARHCIRPGITGPWQVLGSSQIPFDEMVKLDYLYLTNRSLWSGRPPHPSHPARRGRAAGSELGPDEIGLGGPCA